jgi:hypothetical protein
MVFYLYSYIYGGILMRISEQKEVHFVALPLPVCELGRVTLDPDQEF